MTTPTDSSRVPRGVWAGLGTAVVLDTLVQICWKAAVRGVDEHASLAQTLLATATQPMFILLLAMFVLQFVNWMLVLGKADLSYAQPITALSYVATSVCSAMLFGDALPMSRIAGIGLILLGVWMVSGSEHRTTPPGGTTGAA